MSLTEHLQLVAEVYGGHDAVQLTRIVPLVPGLDIPQCDLTPIISEIKRFYLKFINTDQLLTCAPVYPRCRP